MHRLERWMTGRWHAPLPIAVHLSGALWGPNGARALLWGAGEGVQVPVLEYEVMRKSSAARVQRRRKCCDKPS
ncbi:protein of unknown function [Pseudomonas sp. JV551A1]|nr:protein of unknown function [Pseudomonas sp. JV551A1]